MPVVSVIAEIATVLSLFAVTAKATAPDDLRARGRLNAGNSARERERQQPPRMSSGCLVRAQANPALYSITPKSWNCFVAVIGFANLTAHNSSIPAAVNARC